MVYGEMSVEKIQGKIEAADCIYIGGGDTVYMLEKWKETGVDKMIISAYEQGKIICGLSAGAICWFKDMYTDYEIMRGQSSNYVLKKGLGVLDGAMCPHFNEREQDFTDALKKGVINGAYCVENDCAIEFVDGKFSSVISAGGKAYYLSLDGENVLKKEL
jgi:peptidase E